MSEHLFQGKAVSSDRLLYTPSEFAKSSLIYLQEIGSLQAKSTHTSKRQNLESFLFFYVKSGSGVLDYNGKEHPVRQGDCVFINCKKKWKHKWHYGNPSRNRWDSEKNKNRTLFHVLSF